MDDLCLWQRTQESQSQRLSSTSVVGGEEMVVITILHFCILSLCFISSAAWADRRALSSIASFRKSLCRVDLINCFFWLTFDSQVSSSSVWPWGTLELARKLSHGCDFLATGSSSVRMVILPSYNSTKGKGRGEVPHKLDTNENVSLTQNACARWVQIFFRLTFHESMTEKLNTRYDYTPVSEIWTWSFTKEQTF